MLSVEDARLPDGEMERSTYVDGKHRQEARGKPACDRTRALSILTLRIGVVYRGPSAAPLWNKDPALR